MQYCSIQDAWGYNNVEKKNSIENFDNDIIETYTETIKEKIKKNKKKK